MNTIMIRNVNDQVIAALNHQARQKHMSREQFLRLQLQNLAESPALKEMDEKHTLALKKIVDVLEDMNTMMLELLKQNEMKG